MTLHDLEVKRLVHDASMRWSNKMVELEDEQLQTFGGYLQDFIEDLLNYPLVRPWRESLDLFQEHYWEQAGMRLAGESYDDCAARIEQAINDPRCPAHGPIRPESTATLARQTPNWLLGPAQPRPPGGVPPEQDLVLRRLAHHVAELEQKRIGLSDEETALYEANRYESFRRQHVGDRPLEYPDFWRAKNDVVNRKLRGPAIQARDPARKPVAAKAAEPNSPETARTHIVSVAPNASGPPESTKASTSPPAPSVSPPANSDGIKPDDYTTATQEAIRVLGADWKNVSIDAIRRLQAAGQAINQPTGAVLGHGSNALSVETFVRLKRKDGRVDTAHFRLVMPWFSPAHWELVEIKRGATPEQEAAKLAAREKIRHADVLRVRGAINRLQGGMFAIVGGAAGVLEGAPLLGTLEAAAGAEQAGLAGVDLATGKENRAWSARAIQAALEAAGVDAETAKFLADQGGLLVALGRATVDAAGAAHAVIETSTGYRIRLEFNPATLSTNGLGGAKIKVTRLAPDGTEIKFTGGETPGNLTAAPSPKPPLPPPVAEVRAPIGRGKTKPYEPHVSAAASEEALANAVHALPNEVVIRWGKPVTANGPDLISYNRETKRITFWDDKMRSDARTIGPSKTFQKPTTMNNAIKEAQDAITSSQLSAEDKAAAFNSLRENTFQTRTHGSGNVKNSTFGDHQ